MRYTVEFGEDTSIEISRFVAAQGMSQELFIERVGGLVMGVTNACNHGVAARDLTIRKRMDRNSRALHCYRARSWDR